MSRKIRLKRGNLADLPQLELGEPGVATDDGSLYIGTDRGNVRLANQDDLDGVSQQLADNANKTKGLVNLAEYPRLSSESSDSPRIKRALDDLPEGGRLLLSGDTLEITEPIVVSTKNVQITSFNKTTIKAMTAMTACIQLNAKNPDTINYGTRIDNINFNGNKIADYCILVEDRVGLYVSETKITGCSMYNAVLDGVKVGAPAWVVKLDNCNITFNGRDGIRVATNGSKQVNAVRITNNLINNNIGNGVSLSGIIHEVFGNDIESNYYGVCIDPASIDPTGVAHAYKPVIKNNYIELNKQAQIYVKASTGRLVTGLNINENYLWANNADGSGALILIEGSLGQVKLTMRDNTYNLDGSKVSKILNGNNVLGTDSDVGIVTVPTQFVNLGLAKSTFYNYKVVSIPPATIQNGSYTFEQKSTNILSLADKKIAFAVPNDVALKLVRSLNIYTETDSTDYTVRIDLYNKKLSTGATSKSGYTDINKTSSSLIFVNLLSFWGYERRDADDYMYFVVEVRNANGTFLNFNVPYLEMTH